MTGTYILVRLPHAGHSHCKAGIDVRQCVSVVWCTQVVAEYRGQQRAARQQHLESREVERCMERMVSQVAAKENAINHEVRVVSLTYHVTALCLTMLCCRSMLIPQLTGGLCSWPGPITHGFESKAKGAAESRAQA